MNELPGILCSLFVIFGLIYIIFIKSKIEEARQNRSFDCSVLAFIDGLYLAGVEFKCIRLDLKCYVANQLHKAHKLSGNEFLIEHTTAKGLHYSSHIGEHDHPLFAILCITQYAKEYGNGALLSWCESVLPEASRQSNAIYF